MRGLKVAVVGMGVLIVVGVVGLVAAVAYRSASRSASVAPAQGGVALPATILPDLLLDEPAGSRIAAVGQGDGRTVLLVQGGGPDRVVVVDGRTGQVLQRVRLAR